MRKAYNRKRSKKSEAYRKQRLKEWIKMYPDYCWRVFYHMYGLAIKEKFNIEFRKLNNGREAIE